jgi:hypothetical protein
MDKFLDMKKTLMDKNEDVIASLGLMKFNESNNRIKVIFFLFLAFSSFFFVQV